MQPGKKDSGNQSSRARSSDFRTLYGQNCSGCHGVDGKGGAAIALANPVYLAIADDSILRRTASKGVRGTSMPAFAQSAGGMLTEKQIDVIVAGIRSWAKPETFSWHELRRPIRPKCGRPARGGACVQNVLFFLPWRGRQRREQGQLDRGWFVSRLLSDQQLRTIVIAGRPELGAPDWRGNVPGRPMSTQEVTDVVAWLFRQRPQSPGQPYPISSKSRANGGSR